MKKYPLVSIIIPLYIITDRFFEDFKTFEKLDYPSFEILVVCDKKVTLPKLKKISVRLIMTRQAQTGPAEKRDLALKKAKGEICAFIDDDAYPDKQWLREGVILFQQPKIVAVGGSGLTPRDDPFLARAGGHVYESILVSGGFRERFLIGSKKKFVRDWPAYNFLAKTSVLRNVGGWGSNFYGGEDTLLCLKLLEKGKIIYGPNVVVYHHRRPLLLPHIRQIYNVSVHRGFFARVFPKTSRLFIYFVPTLLNVYLVCFLLICFFSPNLFYFLIIQLLAGFGLAYISVFKNAGFAGSIVAAFGVIATHVIYGIGFVKGYMTRHLNH